MRAVFNAFGPRNAVFEEGEVEAAPAMPWIAAACRRENLLADGWGAQIYAAADRDECTAAEAERLVRSFLSAGIDTTVNGIAHMVLAFATRPEEWDKLRADLSRAVGLACHRWIERSHFSDDQDYNAAVADLSERVHQTLQKSNSRNFGVP